MYALCPFKINHLKTYLNLGTLLIVSAFIPSEQVKAEDHLPKLSRELLLKNSNVIESKVSLQKSEIDIDLHAAQLNLGLTYSFEYDDAKLERSPTYTAIPSKSYDHTLAFSKSWYHGGSLTFSNNFNTASGSNFIRSFGEISGFSQSLSYSIDLGANLFGRQTRMQRQVLRETTGLNQEVYSHTQEEQVLNLALNYTQARLSMAVENLDREALERAQKRERLIRNRVRDGLKLKVDLYQSEMSTKQQQEALDSSQVMKDTSFESLGKQLHRKISVEEVESFDFEDVEKEPPMKKVDVHNKSLQVIKKKLELIQSQLKSNNYGYFPNLSLSATYIANDYDNKKTNALKNGLIGSSNREVVLGLNLSWDLGNETTRLNESKYQLEKSLLDRQKFNLEKNISLAEDNLVKKLFTLNKNLESVKLRKDLARKALYEYNKLYNRGRADLDSVIRAEESLINTEKAFVNYIAERDKTCFQLAYLYGDIVNYIQ